MIKREKENCYSVILTSVLRKLAIYFYKKQKVTYFRKKFLNNIDFFAKNNILLRV